MKKLPQKVNKILVIRYKFIGDTVLTVPFLRNLNYQYPDAEIHMLTEPVSGQILKHCPYITRLINYDLKAEYQNINTENTGFQTFWGLVSTIKNQRYDLAFILKKSLSSAFLAFWGGIPYRVGFDTDYRGLLLTHKVYYDMLKHEAECYLDLLRALNLPVIDNYLEAWLTEKEKLAVDNLLNDNPTKASKKVLINACSYNANKMWPASNFAQLIEELSNNFDTQIYFLGIDPDLCVYEEILAKIKLPLKYSPLNLLGKTSLLESIEFIKRMNLVISIDSGVVHMSASVGTPIIAIFGPMNEAKWAPFSNKNAVVTSSVECRPCNLSKNCECEQICLTSISHKGVLAMAVKYLRNE